MSTLVSIMFLFIGAAITALAFIKPFKGKKIILVLCFIVFIVVGIWEIINKNADSNNSENDIKETVNKVDTSIGVKVDNSTSLIKKNSDSNANNIIKSIPIPKQENQSKYDLKNAKFNAPVQLGNHNIQNN